MGLETAILGLSATIAAALLIWVTKNRWEWLNSPYDFKASRHLPLWLRGLRRWMTSEPRDKLTPKQWACWYIYCPMEGHEFPRGLPNDQGRWNFGETWHGVCRKCTAFVTEYSEEALDKAESDGKRVRRLRKPVRPGSWRGQ
jgi:hypothetical protein